MSSSTRLHRRGDTGRKPHFGRTARSIKGYKTRGTGRRGVQWSPRGSRAFPALEDACHPPAQIILRGDEEIMMSWRLEILEHLPIRSQIYTISDEEQVLPTILLNMKSVNGVSAFVCEGFTCHPPITDLDELTNYLKQRKPQ